MTQVLFSYGWDLLFLGDEFDTLAAAGAALVMAGVVAVALAGAQADVQGAIGFLEREGSREEPLIGGMDSMNDSRRTSMDMAPEHLHRRSHAEELALPLLMHDGHAKQPVDSPAARASLEVR